MIADNILNKSLDQLFTVDQILAKTKKSIDQLNGITDDGDRLWFVYVSSLEFAEKDTKVRDLNFIISQDADFVARRISFALKLHRESGESSDPDGFFHSLEFPYNNAGGSGTIVDFQVELTESFEKDGKMIQRPYQDIPIPAQLTYSNNDPTFGSPSALCFDIDWELIRGSNMQCKITVLSAVNGIDPTINTDTYKIIGMLEGYKKIRALK